jgi:hypothetical protein
VILILDVAAQTASFSLEFTTKEERMSKKLHAGAMAGVVVLLFASLAQAHPQLQSAEPAVGTTAPAPKQIRIMFNEAVIPQFSGVELRDPSGKLVPVGKSETDPANKKMLVVPVKQELSPGEYKVDWHAVSDDTHRVKGNYSFSVGR